MDHGVHILLVEDDVVDRMSVERAFERLKIANPIHVANDGVEALEKLRGTKGTAIPRPFIVLLDWNLPRMPGIEFLREIRSDPELKDSVVFVLTTSKAEEDKAAAYDLNVARYIVKEHVGEQFLSVVTMLGHYWRIVELPQ